MLRTCRDTYINYIQCQMATYAGNLANMISYGNCETKVYFKWLTVLDGYLDILKCHQVLNFAYLIRVQNKVHTLVLPYTITIFVGAGEQLLDLTITVPAGSYTADAFAAEIANQINLLGYTYIFALSSGTDVLIYSYEPLANSSVTIIDSDGRIAENRVALDTDTVLSGIIYYNCLSEIEICNIINHALYIVDNEFADTICSTC